MSLALATRSSGTLDAIVEATRQILSDKGYAGLSMREVAAAAGLTAGAIYRHFPSKRALVDHVARASFEEFTVRLLESASRQAPGSFDRVVALGEAYIHFAMERPEDFKVLFTLARPAPTRLSDLPRQGGFDLLRQAIVEATQSGQMRAVDPDLATFFFWSRIHGIVTLLMACDFSQCLPLEKREITPERLFELSRHLIWEGLKPSDADGPNR